MQQYDIVVVGAGMVGASLVNGLSNQGLHILAIDAAPAPTPTRSFSPSFDARSTAISYGSVGIFEALGVWQAISQHAQAIKTVHVSEKGRFATTRLEASELGHDALGYVVQNAWLGQCLHWQLAQGDGLKLQAATRLAWARPSETGYRLGLLDQAGKEQEVSCRLCIVADGAGSQTASMLGVDFLYKDYQQQAVIANIQTDFANQGVAFERFTPAGPLALLPLTQTRSALVWTLPNCEVETCLAWSDADFASALLQQFGERLGTIAKVGQRTCYPLKLVQAKEQIRPGLVLLGNATTSLHPVAGQGFNLALRAVANLLESVLDYDWQASAAENFPVLKRYLHRQTRDQQKTVLFSDQLIKIFGDDSLLLGLAREAGLAGLDLLPGLQSAFARHAMGLGGRKARFKQVTRAKHGSRSS